MAMAIEDIMRIPIPSLPPRARALFERYTEWINVPIWRSPEGRLTFRRIDVLLLFFGIAITVYYYVFYGWQTAIIGTSMYVLVLMAALWIF
jgi:glucose-6-phosphate-specific signal transduction histidine kinase